MKLLLKYLGYFLAVSSAVGIIYGIGVFFANIQSDIKHVVNTVTEIKATQSDQAEQIRSINYEMMEITTAQAKQRSFNFAIDRSWSDHLKKSKDLIDEYTKYLELQVQDEKKKNYTDSVMSKIKHDFSIQKVK